MTAIEHEPARSVALTRQPPSGASVAAARLSDFWSRPALREFLLLVAVYEPYSLTRRLTTGGAVEAMANARHVLRVEHVVGLAPERWINHAVSTRPYLAIPADYAYATLHYAVTLIVLVWLWRAHPIAYLSARAP